MAYILVTSKDLLRLKDLENRYEEFSDWGSRAGCTAVEGLGGLMWSYKKKRYEVGFQVSDELKDKMIEENGLFPDSKGVYHLI